MNSRSRRFRKFAHSWSEISTSPRYERSRIMNSLQKTAAVGLFVLIGAAAFLFGALWLRGKSVGKSDVNIKYADIGNLKEGAPVRISGAPVGRVTDVIYQGE